MLNQKVITKILLSLSGLALVVASFNLLMASPSFQNNKEEENKSAVLSFSSTTITHIKNTPHINPELKIVLEQDTNISGFALTYEVIGTKKGLAIPPNIIEPNNDLLKNGNCKTTFNEENLNYLLSCYFEPIQLSGNANIANMNLEVIEKLATRDIVTIKIKDTNSYLTLNSSDMALVLTNNEFKINFVSIPKECLNKPLSDINCDGAINTFDIVLFESDKNKLENYLIHRLDLNSDGNIDSEDKDMFEKAIKLLNT